MTPTPPPKGEGVCGAPTCVSCLNNAYGNECPTCAYHHALLASVTRERDVAESCLWDVMERMPGIYDEGARKGAREQANAYLDSTLARASPKNGGKP
jgi:hypothetical protein